MFWSKTSDTLSSRVKREFLWALTFFELVVELICPGTGEAHVGSFVPEMGVVALYAFPLELIRSRLRTDTPLAFHVKNVGLRAMGAQVGFRVPIVRI